MTLSFLNFIICVYLFTAVLVRFELSFWIQFFTIGRLSDLFKYDIFSMRAKETISKHTQPPKKRNPSHSIALYWPDFQGHNSQSNIVIFKGFMNLRFFWHLLSSNWPISLRGIDLWRLRKIWKIRHLVRKRWKWRFHRTFILLIT